MATMVCFHAHPDDEAIIMGGTMARAARSGHRVVLVVATRGEHGEVAEGVLEPGEPLGARREVETHRAAKILGAARVEFLGYVDSGMAGTPENEARGSFASADLEEAAGRLAAILREEQADVLTIYDSNGNYGHPDHVQVHRVGVRASELAETPQVLEATMNRDHLRELLETARAAGELPEEELPDLDNPDEIFGQPDAVITTRIDVRDLIDVKREAMAAHASQIAETSFFLQMPSEMFVGSFGLEWFIRRGAPAGHRDDDVFATP
jgi:LmbE family N-acetylglucosaminyl deacetylase